MSEKALTIRKYYELGFWTKEKVQLAAQKGLITAEECKAILSAEHDNP